MSSFCKLDENEEEFDKLEEIALYIDNMSEEDAATLMGYKTNEKNRVPGYKQIKNVKKSIIVKVKKIIASGEIEIL